MMKEFSVWNQNITLT